MTAELYRGRSKTSRFQFEGEMVSGFNAGIGLVPGNAHVFTDTVSVGQKVGFSLKCDLGTSSPGRDVFFLGLFNPQIGHQDVEQLLCQDSGSGPARLEVRKIVAESVRFLVSAW